MSLHALYVYWISSSLQILIGSHIYDALLKMLGKWSVQFCRSWPYLTLSDKPFLYKIQIKPKIKYYCHIWIVAVRSSLSNIERIQNCSCDLMKQDLFSTLYPLSYRRKSIATIPIFLWQIFG